jgi:hypothetical protein
MEMTFPRPVMLVGDCIALVALNKNSATGIMAGDAIFGKYPTVIYHGEQWNAHRLSYHINVEPIPRTRHDIRVGLVLHSCDNKWCVNPEHLRLGTFSENVRDMYDRHPTILSSLSDAAKRQVENGTCALLNLSDESMEKGRKKSSASRVGVARPDDVKRKISRGLKAAWAEGRR